MFSVSFSCLYFFQVDDIVFLVNCGASCYNIPLEKKPVHLSLLKHIFKCQLCSISSMWWKLPEAHSDGFLKSCLVIHGHLLFEGFPCLDKLDLFPMYFSHVHGPARPCFSVAFNTEATYCHFCSLCHIFLYTYKYFGMGRQSLRYGIAMPCSCNHTSH